VERLGSRLPLAVIIFLIRVALLSGLLHFLDAGVERSKTNYAT